MRVTQQLMRVLREEIESLEYGTVKVTINASGNYFEISSEKRIRIVKTPEESILPASFHKG